MTYDVRVRILCLGMAEIVGNIELQVRSNIEFSPSQGYFISYNVPMNAIYKDKAKRISWGVGKPTWARFAT